MKTLKILGLAAALVLLGGAVAYAADQVIDQVQPDETTEGRVCNENNVRTNNPDDLGVEVRTQTRTRLAWDDAAECDGDQTRLRTQDRLSWPEVPEEDGPARTLNQTRSSQAVEDPEATEDPAAPAAGPNGPGDGSCD
ncbi:MAG: hypothetical protein JW767_00820 [Thermoleophilia bacterium]|nr:hypothetical protein [Thermoleophilia bacterium]